MFLDARWPIGHGGRTQSSSDSMPAERRMGTARGLSGVLFTDPPGSAIVARFGRQERLNGTEVWGSRSFVADEPVGGVP